MLLASVIASSKSIYFPLISIYIYMHQRDKTEEKKEEVEPQGQALVKRTRRGEKRTNKKNVSGKESRAMQA